MGFVADSDLPGRVKEILERHFDGAAVKVDRFSGARKVSGQIVWKRFEDQEQIDRQRAVYNVLRDELGADARGVSIILAYTPHEVKMMRAA